MAPNIFKLKIQSGPRTTIEWVRKCVLDQRFQSKEFIHEAQFPVYDFLDQDKDEVFTFNDADSLSFVMWANQSYEAQQGRTEEQAGQEHAGLSQAEQDALTAQAR